MLSLVFSRKASPSSRIKEISTSSQDASVGGHAASSHNHIETATEMQNSRHSEPSETELNGSLTATELRKPGLHPDWQEGRRHGTGLSHIHR